MRSLRAAALWWNPTRAQGSRNRECLSGILLRAFLLSSSSTLSVPIKAQAHKRHHSCVCSRKRSSKARQGLSEMLELGFLQGMVEGAGLHTQPEVQPKQEPSQGVGGAGREQPGMNPHTLPLDSLRDPEPVKALCCPALF